MTTTKQDGYQLLDDKDEMGIASPSEIAAEDQALRDYGIEHAIFTRHAQQLTAKLEWAFERINALEATLAKHDSRLIDLLVRVTEQQRSK